ncbi:signal recognition particle-docking protein FtsY [Humidesulfovibrio mexicanus]|uniref:Signal recognition particle receptor FtsY n=1 Tax=Humidesulfovibrio mexicanus TaxID=147047 RepID=A0A238ZIX0_9BACT|nr:signal recognition particle-docking protein FtsY [Humidesulfovibrio mexicanus]SNR82654.1 signal recognition particle-docking protein FtsY [Humidesulfovibrio mexicanus]
MGFFTKIKKLWGGETDEVQASARAATAQDTPQTGLEQPPDAATHAPQLDPLWKAGLESSLRGSRARISEWLGQLLSGLEAADEALWARLRFLFATLGAPEAEAETFVSEFKAWLAAMGMTKVEDFRSELRYRLILALDLEQEEEERGNVFQKLTRGLAKTRERLSAGLGALFGRTGELDAAFWDELEELFIMADVGAEATRKLLDNLRSRARSMGVTEAARFREVLSAELEELFPLPKKPKVTAPPEVVMMIGVNGVGKTTTIAKLAYRARLQGRKVLIAAGDTFRAAAIDQLKIWAGRVGAGIFAKAEGADPAAVAFEAVDHALKEGYDLVLLDTAGRLHTKVNLMEELRKIKRVLDKKHSGAPHKSVLVIDATTGQNALSQTKLFNEAVGVDEIVLTKLDGTAKGGVMVGVAISHKLPISFVGLGEKMEDLRPFVGEDFAKALLGQ